LVILVGRKLHKNCYKIPNISIISQLRKGKNILKVIAIFNRKNLEFPNNKISTISWKDFHYLRSKSYLKMTKRFQISSIQQTQKISRAFEILCWEREQKIIATSEIFAS